jgi:RNA polymerase sigma-70 factor (ECF subfamily)
VERRPPITRSPGRPHPRETDAIRAARRGDTVAFGELYRRYLGDVREFCARRIGDPIRAEDLAQDTFLKAWEKIGTFRQGAAFWPWVSTIARNLCIDELRRRGRAVEGSDAKIGEGPDALDPTAEPALAEDAKTRIGVALAAAMDRLDDRERALLWNHAVDELTWGEIASRHKISTHAARNAAWRARGFLRSILLESLGDLRAWLVWPVWAFVVSLRRRRSRLQARLSLSWIAAGEAVAERTAELVAATLVSVGLLVGSHGTAAATPRVTRPPVTRVVGAHARRIASATAHADQKVRIADEKVNGRAVAASVSATSRPGGASPSSAYYRVEIRAPDGRVVYWNETTMHCGDGRRSRLIPQNGVATAYC